MPVENTSKNSQKSKLKLQWVIVIGFFALSIIGLSVLYQRW